MSLTGFSSQSVLSLYKLNDHGPNILLKCPEVIVIQKTFTEIASSEDSGALLTFE